MRTGSTSVNSKAYRKGWVAKELTKVAGRGLLPEERFCIERIPPDARGRILDIGIGTGRTADVLSGIFKEYVGVDYSPELVRLAVESHPDLDIRVMDGRSLAFSAEFDVVMFSWNGIDSVDFGSRLRILSEMRRVLKPGGYLVYSTHNLHHDRVGPLMDKFWVRELMAMRSLPLRIVNRIRNFHRSTRDDTNGIYFVNDLGIGFGLVNAYVDLEKESQRLGDLGLKVLVQIGNTQSSPTFDERDCWVCILARAVAPPKAFGVVAA